MLVYSESVPRKLGDDHPNQGPSNGPGRLGQRYDDTTLKKSLALLLCCALALSPNASAYSVYGEENPFVEAMLRMMEIFGLINRDRLPLSVPYLPGYGGLGGLAGTSGLSPLSGLGGVPGYSSLGGFGGVPGLSPLSGFGGVPGMSPFAGLGGVPGVSTLPGLSTVPGYGMAPGMGAWPGAPIPGIGVPPGNWAGPGYYGGGPAAHQSTALDGIWELDNGGMAIIRGNAARLYLSREQYQDFSIGYDRAYLWWQPRRGGSPSRYRYQIREGRMILQDEEGKVLFMRRRR